MQRAVGSVNLTRWVAHRAGRQLPKLALLPCCYRLLLLLPLPALLPMLPPTAAAAASEQSTMERSALLICGPSLRRFAGYHRFAASWQGGGGAGALTVVKLKQQICGGG